MMKKVLAVLLLAAMLLSITACGKKNRPADMPAAEQNQGENEEKDIPITWRELSTDVTMETKQLTCKDGSVVTIGPLTYDEYSVNIGVSFKNNTKEERRAEITTMAINDLMVHPGMAVWAMPGEETKDTVSIDRDELRMSGIFAVEKIDLMVETTNSQWENEEVITAQLTTSAKPEKITDAYYKTIQSVEAQEELGLFLVDAVNERIGLGKDLYLESKAYVNMYGIEYLLLEVVNEGDKLRNLFYSTEQINTMKAAEGLDCRIYPGAKAIVQLDLTNALPQTKMKAFGMTEIYQVLFQTSVYDCDELGHVDWESADKAMEFTYQVPGVTVTAPDMTGTVLHQQEGLRISYKAPVVDDWGCTVIYMIYEADPALRLNVEQDWDQEIQVDGACDWSNLNTPGLMERAIDIQQLELENLEAAASVTFWLRIYAYAEDDTEGTPLKLTIPL